MGASSPEPSARRFVRPRAALLGAALGSVALTGASLVLYESTGLLSGATGLISTLLVCLLVGIWAGAPGAEHDPPPYRDRWAVAGIATALAGTFATVWGFVGALETSATGRVLGLLVLIAAPAYACGMLLPVLLAWSERWEDESEDAEESGGWGALGGLVAGMLAGLTLGVLVTGLVLLPWLRPGPLLLAVSVALLAPILLPEPPRPATLEQTLYEKTTPFGTLRVTEVVFPGERQPERRLYLNGEQESGELVRSGAPTLAYIAAAESWLAGGTPLGSSYLFLGGGAYTLPRRIAERDPRAQVTVVELDPEVSRIAYRFFGLRRDHGVLSVQGDARAYLERGAAPVDRLYVDVYGGDEAVPYALVTVEAFSAMHRLLRPGGLVALNLIGTAVGPETVRLWSVVRTLMEVFPAVALYFHLGPDYPERQNFLLAASPDPQHSFPERAGLFERWPAEQWPVTEGTLVFRDLFPAAAPARPAGSDRVTR